MARPDNGPDWALSPSDWGARVDYDSWTDRYTPDKAVALHHGGNGDYPAAQEPYSVEKEMAQLRAWEKWHVEGRGWRGLAYGWGIGQSGTVYRIRGWNTYGAHTGDWDGDGVNNNSDTIPFIWIASGNHHRVSPQAHLAIVRLRRYVEAESGRPLRFMGHQEVQSGTACPGTNGMDYVRANRHLPDEEDDMRVREFVQGLKPGNIDELFDAGIIRGDRNYWKDLLSKPEDPAWHRFVTEIEVRTAINSARQASGAAGPYKLTLTGEATPR